MKKIDINSNTRNTYYTWSGMKQRCLNSNHTEYHNYGGRGISICDRWMYFKNFLEDMGERPEGLTLDRIDNNGNYEPSNCRWATWNDQAQNRSDFVRTKPFIHVVKDMLYLGFLQTEIAGIMNCSQATISKIKRNVAFETKGLL